MIEHLQHSIHIAGLTRIDETPSPLGRHSLLLLQSSRCWWAQCRRRVFGRSELGRWAGPR